MTLGKYKQNLFWTFCRGIEIGVNQCFFFFLSCYKINIRKLIEYMFVNKIRGKKQCKLWILNQFILLCYLEQSHADWSKPKAFRPQRIFFLGGGGAGGKSRTSATVFFNLGQARVLMVTFINFCIYKTVFVITKK